MLTPKLRVAEYHALVFTKWWRGAVVFSIFTPLMYLAAMGVGLGTLVGDDAREASLDGVSYLDFVGPGLLVASIMQSSAGMSMWPIMGGLKWQRTWHAMLATPIGVADIVDGWFAHIAARLALGGAGYVLPLFLFGVAEGPVALLALPAGVLCGMAFATPISAYSATRETDQAFIVLFRIAIMPMFLFSGAFFPVDQLPRWLEAVAKVTPLYHGIELVRGLVLDRVDAGGAFLNIAYLTAWTAAGWYASRRAFRWRMVR